MPSICKSLTGHRWEELILAEITSRYPEHGILSEESAAKNEQAALRWIIDPLDGTTNYAHGFPFFCVSIALEKEGAVVLGVIYDPDVPRDMLAALDRAVPLSANYRHAEGNSAAHVKSSLVGASEMIIIENGRLVLGTWQSIFFCEFDGPRTRKVYISFK